MHVGERFAQAESSKKSFEIEATADLEIRTASFLVPIRSADEIARAVSPLAKRDVQVLVTPFGSTRQISHFVSAALQSVPPQGRLYAGFLNFRNIAAEFQLQ